MRPGAFVRLGAFAFTPRPVPSLAAAALAALTFSLGGWQADRAAEKTQRQALLEARLLEPRVDLTGAVSSADSLLFRRVRARGEYVAGGQIFIDNRIHGGRAGFHVVTPLALSAGGAVVLVNRGWVARSRAYPAAPEVPVPVGEQLVEGLATVPPARVLELSAETVSGNVWQNLAIPRYAARSKVPVLPVVILAPPAPGLAAVDEKPDAGVAKHREYSLTWYSLAATLVALWIGLNLRRAPR
jgi:surfeit locus 1 family protein